VPASENLGTETVIDMVGTGEYDLTITDSHILDVELSWRNDILGAFTVGDTAAHAWAAIRTAGSVGWKKSCRFWHGRSTAPEPATVIAAVGSRSTMSNRYGNGTEHTVRQ